MSFDGGATWAVSTARTEFGTAVANPGIPNDLYVLTGSGFQASFDGGHTFSPPLPNSVYPNGGAYQLIAVPPQAPTTVYVATSTGVSVSSDGGSTFTATSWPITKPGVIAIDPENDANIYLAPVFGNPGTVMYSKDGGKTFQTSTVSSCTISTIAIDPLNSDTVAAGDYCGAVYLSSDGGGSFALKSSIPAVGDFNLQIWRLLFDPLGSGVLAASGTSGLYLSSDQGAHWTSIRGNAVPFFFQDMQWSGNNLYAATQGEGVLQLEH